MKIEIFREYYPSGTNGHLFVDGVKLCNTIELPNKNNKSRVSCIPEGEYNISKRTSEKHGKHLQVMNVPNRDLILFHPANNALLELMGCIAPVTKLTGVGTGSLSKPAFKSLITAVYAAIDKGESVKLIIKRL